MKIGDSAKVADNEKEDYKVSTAVSFREEHNAVHDGTKHRHHSDNNNPMEQNRLIAYLSLFVFLLLHGLPLVIISFQLLHCITCSE